MTSSKFLIVKTSSLGDIIHAFPVAQYLRDRFPDAQIDWVVEKPFAELVERHPAVDNVLVVDTKKWRRAPWRSPWRFGEARSFCRALRSQHYDVLFDLQGNLKSALVVLCAKASNKVGFGRKTVPESLNLLATNQRYDPPAGNNIRDDYLFLVRSFFGDEQPFQDPGVRLLVSEEEASHIDEILADDRLQGGARVLVCPGANWRNKRLPIDVLADFLKGYSHEHEHKHKYLFAWGTVEEKADCELLQQDFPHSSVVIDKLSLAVLQNLMAQVDLVIAMDSLPLHLCGTTSTPSFSVFGSSSAAKYRPPGSHHVAMQGVCPYGRTFEKRCPILRRCTTGACIRDIKAKELRKCVKIRGFKGVFIRLQ